MENGSSQYDVDLKEVYSSFKSRGIRTSHSFLRFLRNNFIPIFILLIIGGAIGYYADSTIKKYKSTIIVSPNFNTVDYLYERVDLLNTLIHEDDKADITALGILHSEDIKEITINPITDIYNFVVKDDLNFNVFKTLSENSSANDVIQDLNTSKNFPRHLIEVQTKNKIPMSELKGIMAFLNDSEFYEQMRVQIYKNVEDEIVMSESVIKQIDTILNNKTNASQLEGSVYINESNELNQLVERKVTLKNTIYNLNTHLFNLKYIITPISYFNNMDRESMVFGKLKFILPVFLILSFLFFKLVRSIALTKPNELA